jgi:hypothetical protein
MNPTPRLLGPYLAFHVLLAAGSARAQSPQTTWASATNSGTPQGAASLAISPDGRYVGFASLSADIVAGDSNGTWDVFVRDRVTGAVEIASRSSAGTQGHPPGFPTLDERRVALALSQDARFVVFTSGAPDLVAGDTNDSIDVFVRDRLAGTTELASVGIGGAPANGHSALTLTTHGGGGTSYRYFGLPIAVTPDGRFVAFSSAASNLVAGDAGGGLDVFVRDRHLGVTELVSLADSGAQADGASVSPAISDDGRFVVFHSWARNLAPNEFGTTNVDVFVRDRQLGTTRRISTAADGWPGNAHSGTYIFTSSPGVCGSCPPQLVLLGSAISGDGRYVAFGSLATNLDSVVAIGQPHVFVHDRLAGTLTNATPAASAGAALPSLSFDGRFLLLASDASDLGPPDSNPGSDAYRIDLVLGTVTLESVDAFGVQRGGNAWDMALARDGHQLAFLSSADLLTGGPMLPGLEAWARNAPTASFAEDCAGLVATCPCANAGAPGHGCANSFDSLGARLTASGLPAVSSDTLVLAATSLQEASPTIFVQAQASSPSVAALAFGDGVLCLASPFTRLGTRVAQYGAATLGGAWEPRVSVLGHVPAAGGTMYYQAVYRNDAAYCTSATFNTTNSIAVSWRP